MQAIELYDILLRAASSGILVLTGTLVCYRYAIKSASGLMGLFMIFVSAYLLISSPVIWSNMGDERYLLRAMANIAIVFFWLGTCRLFDDEFVWRPWRFIPLFILVGVIIARALSPNRLGPVVNLLQHSLTFCLMGHVIFLILSRHQTDLIQLRRQIVLPYLISIAVLAILVATGELANILTPEMSEKASLLHGVLLTTAVLVIGFILTAPIPFFERISARQEAKERDEVDPQLLNELASSMEQGVYREEGLRIGELASKLRIPAHQLRLIINQELGYRNFSSFLNEYRVRDAKQILSNPDHQKQQILQIAYSLGYQSTGSFNRAFKNATGLTPSAYRSLQLEQSVPETESTSRKEK